MGNKIIFRHCVIIMFLCALCSSAASYGTRKEYTLPFRVGSDYIPIQATISCQSWEIDKSFGGISNSDPDFLIFVKELMNALLEGDAKNVKDMIISESSDESALITNFTSIPSFYQKYDMDSVAIKTVVFIEEYVYMFCVASNNGEQKILNYLIRQKEDGNWGWIAFGYGKLDFAVVPIFESLKHRFLDEDKFQVATDSEFSHRTIVTPDPTNVNFVAVNYNAISFEEGVPLFDEKGYDLQRFLFKYYECELHGRFNDRSKFYDTESFKKIRKGIELSDITAEAYAADMQPRLKEEPYTSLRLKFAIMADPVIIIYQAYQNSVPVHETSRVLYRGDSEYKFIRHNSYDALRDLFGKVRILRGSDRSERQISVK